MKLILLAAIMGCLVINSPVAIPVSANEGVIKIGSVATSGALTLSGLENHWRRTPGRVVRAGIASFLSGEITNFTELLLINNAIHFVGRSLLNTNSGMGLLNLFYSLLPSR